MKGACAEGESWGWHWEIDDVHDAGHVENVVGWKVSPVMDCGEGGVVISWDRNVICVMCLFVKIEYELCSFHCSVFGNFHEAVFDVVCEFWDDEIMGWRLIVEVGDDLFEAGGHVVV